MDSRAPLSGSFYHALAALAERLRRTIMDLADSDRFPFVSQRVAESQVVFGVWPDTAGNEGSGFHLIKGRGYLAALSGELPDESIMTAIPCVGMEQAVAAEAYWGELARSTDQVVPPGKPQKSKARPKARSAAKRGSAASKARRAKR